MVRHNRNISELWRKLPWKQFRRNLFRLQKRVYKAVRAGDTRKARSLQKLILKSQAARFLAIRQVTQLNQGRKTAGIDGKTALTFEERFELEISLKANANDWKHKGLKEIPIPKKDGTKRILKVPTVYSYCTSYNRSWECSSNACYLASLLSKWQVMKKNQPIMMAQLLREILIMAGFPLLDITM